MCYSGRCPYEHWWTGACGKKAHEVCPWSEGGEAEKETYYAQIDGEEHMEKENER